MPAGRPKGVKDSKPRAPRTAPRSRFIQATIKGQLPLDIMLMRMMRLWKDGTASEEDQDKAVAIAKDAAPYVHPRLSAVEAKVTHEDLRQVREDLLIAELQVLASQLGDLTPPEVLKLASEPAEPRH